MVTAMEKLRDKLSKYSYQNADVTSRDVLNTVTQFRGLSHQIEPFVFNDGKEKQLCKLHGTIPVPYKGQNYNIPVCIWIMDTHPNNAPLCYVKPTSDMVLKISRSTDHSGKIYLPQLHLWDPRQPNLLPNLVQAMISAFSVEPPVYAKPRETSHQQQQANQQQSSSFTPYPTQPYMPVPSGGGNPPYPTANSGYNSAPYPPATPYSGGFPAPYPGYNSQSGSNSGYPPYPTGGNQLPYPAYPSGQYPAGPSMPPSATTQNSGIDSGTGTITEEHIRASLLSAVEDKMRRSLREQSSRARDELDILRQTESELRAGKNRLDNILSRLSKEQEELDKNISMLKDKEEELSKATERLSDQEVDVDEAVTTTAPLYKQILNSYAEEAALEDTIYYVGEALRRGVIDLDVFLKQVRSLSRRQFMLRALMQKCRQKAGLK
ncbi:tumor susceptibility gene 101 protein isoform X2 [Frankliniella occidentalis]|uniref:Tumor susceptibility gene 101 protein isoform X2 n=1 Tax=Frankliniella occidentalis TaxID=133901 RepID=A0A6J1SVM2_FRAOC|nr:tumor susceptibility gene 101 protein isoform X2 [Frankliniella occidentalis]